MHIIKKIDKIADTIEKPIWFVSWMILTFITLLSFIIVILRYAFGVGFLWMDEVCRYGFIVIIYLWAGPIIRENGHLQLDFVLKRLPEQWQHFHNTIVQLCQFGVCLFFVCYGVSLIRLSRMLGEVSESFFFQVWWLHLVVVVGMSFVSIFSLLQATKSTLLFMHYKK